MGGSVIFPYPGQIWKLKFLVIVGGGLVIFPCPGQIGNLKFSVKVGGVSHLSMSRPNLKFKIFSEVEGQSSFHVQAKSEIENFHWGWGSFISLCQAKSDIENFWWGWGIGHNSLSRPNLKFKIFIQGGGGSVIISVQKSISASANFMTLSTGPCSSTGNNRLYRC